MKGTFRSLPSSSPIVDLPLDVSSCDRNIIEDQLTSSPDPARQLPLRMLPRCTHHDHDHERLLGVIRVALVDLLALLAHREGWGWVEKTTADTESI